jgi:hypothetical protein
MRTFCSSWFQAASAPATTLLKFQPGISARILASALVVLTGEMPTFSFTTSPAAVAKVTTPFKRLPLAAGVVLPSESVTCRLVNWRMRFDKIAAK